MLRLHFKNFDIDLFILFNEQSAVNNRLLISNNTQSKDQQFLINGED